MVELWHKNEIILCSYRSFCDSDGNGLGDLAGLIEKLDYLQSLGVTCCGCPFFPSPNFEPTATMSEYTGVDHERGTIDEFRRLVEEAPPRASGCYIDLVAHHTSRDHPWFQSARSDAQSPYRDYYIWSDRSPRASNLRTSFRLLSRAFGTTTNWPGAITSTCSTTTSPTCISPIRRSRRKSSRSADYWMSCGIDGFRVDATNHLFEEKVCPAPESTILFFNRLHAISHPPQYWWRSCSPKLTLTKNGSCATGQAFPCISTSC